MKKRLETLQMNYILAKAENETVKEIDKESREKILAEHAFYDTKTDKRITNPDHAYCMGDTEFEEYCKLAHEERTRRGLNIPDWNTTADYKTRKALKKAEDDLIRFSIDIVPEGLKSNIADAGKHWKYRYEVVELIMRLDPKTLPRAI